MKGLFCFSVVPVYTEELDVSESSQLLDSRVTSIVYIAVGIVIIGIGLYLYKKSKYKNSTHI